MPFLATSIAIIGAGSVGAAIAHSLLLRRVVGELILVDIDERKCQAQVSDLVDCTYLSHVRVRQGSFLDASQADIIIITAGAKQNPGETRLNLIDRNFKVVKSVLEAMKGIRSDSILVLVANPVDVLTHFAQQISGLPRNQVLGSGTLLDSIRLRGKLSEKLKVADIAIDAYVLGEHGDSQFVAWSAATVAGMPLSSMANLSDEERLSLANSTKKKAEEIIRVKGFTAQGISAATTSICEAIIFDQRQIFALSHWQNDLKCCLSLPAIIGRSGIQRTVHLPLDESEQRLIAKSAASIRDAISEHDRSQK